MAQPIVLPADLPELVRSAFSRALEAGDVTYFPTQVALLRVNGFPIQLRFAPSLAKKPRPLAEKKDEAASPNSAETSAPFDPFANPPAGLVVLDEVGPAHRLVLNKFAICRDHAILATKEFRPQDHLLAADDLAAAYACIQAYDDASEEGESLFVFYNSGTFSGASQPHRHLQMLPVARMREGLPEEDAAAWKVLMDTTAGDRLALPFYMASSLVRKGLSPEKLHALYRLLYCEACTAVGIPFNSQTLAEDCGEVPARLSYNLGLTRTTMALCPRAVEGAPVESASAAEQVGSISLNGTVLAGTALVKNEAEWTALNENPGQLPVIFGKIGLPTLNEYEA